ncbi:alpha amylase domain protein (macronuclear) [Tetrahymena thermophila SB210]|uniref:Alpha-amylase n=1 Tax=Tetrahymena thermophila (strain SB210) TaxID=312017 RepID=Q22KR2_TETTS|nr:alpha amylase domain protein [Tetrahymena thermophila SB210]EAR85737.2 alpha amylase domain protein [Tetrahymena thermophila SB210]|eukprot:XP_001033400.2 alpha amylase domain protein [Tetrahymena thermophila SB210]
MKKLLLIATSIAILTGLAVYTYSITKSESGAKNLQVQDYCNNYNGENGCKSGTQTDNPPDWENRRWQTPPRGNPMWKESYQDMNVLVGHSQVIYDKSLTSATVNFNTITKDPNAQVQYTFGNNAPQKSNSFKVDTSITELTLKAEIVDSNGKVTATLVIDPQQFVWSHPAVNQPSNYKNGQKGAIVEMFGWPYKDVEQECESLGKMGWMGVKVFPSQEAIFRFDGCENGELNPWYFVYQPVSYRQHARMGTRDELISMINTCRKYNVRVYADAVVNHMTGNGNDAFPDHCSGSNYWGGKNTTAGSPFYTQGYAYQPWNITGQRPGNENPAVPYGPLDFHCERSLNSWSDGFILNYGWLSGLCDLNTEQDNVRQRIADYFTDLMSLGFSGIRIDAAKHISPENLAAIFAKFKANMGGQFPVDFIAYLEVIIGGEKDLLECQNNYYDYAVNFNNLMKQQGLTDSEIYSIKIWSSDYPKEFPICGYWVIPSERFAVENDCHDDQFPGSSSRDMGDKGSVLVKERNEDLHRHFEVELFTRTDGNWQIKLVLSSYSFINDGFGFPDGYSDCALCSTDACKQQCTHSVPKQTAYNPNSCGYDCFENGAWAPNRYTRVHRDLSIVKAMRQWMGLNANVPNSDLGLPQNCQAK